MALYHQWRLWKSGLTLQAPLKDTKLTHSANKENESPSSLNVSQMTMNTSIAESEKPLIKHPEEE